MQRIASLFSADNITNKDMKIKIDKNTIVFVPEDDEDVFNLGRLSMNIPTSRRNIDVTGGKTVLADVEINQKELLNLLFYKTEKK